ncbi:MAG: hypothetical protein GW886_12315 [Rhodobacterales bacterium]|nr:hypothetical protein [Rhodobacterales bacterium]NCT11349.1 hypothetical protein [Rhodobacterales bacterium]
MDDTIATSAEAAENAVLPRLREVHVDAACTGTCEEDLPPAMQSNAAKSAARWAYERLILYIRNFEARLNNDEEIAMGFAGSDTGVIRIEGNGYFDPDIVTFYGTDEEGGRTQLIQHVTQLNVMLRALPRPGAQAAPQRIGFRLATELDSSTRA